MNIRRHTLRSAWLLIGILAFVLTWVHALPYLDGGFLHGTRAFWADALDNTPPAGTFLAIDILFLSVPVIAWMVIEARRLEIDWVWAYVALALAIGISVAVPLFMAVRETVLIRRGDTEVSGLRRADVIGLLVLAVATIVVSVRAAAPVLAG